MTDADITDLLARVRSCTGTDRDAAREDLLEVVYRELWQLAHGRMNRESAEHTLTPTALVHEVYLRLFDTPDDRFSFDNRAHFFAAASEAMRRILVERARRYASQKRGAGARRIELPEQLEGLDLWQRAEDVVAIDRALVRLEEENSRFAQVAKLRFFVGLTVQETADTLQISLRTVERSWTAARAFLLSDLQNRSSSPEHPS